MRIPALPQSKEFKVKAKESLWRAIRKIAASKIEKKRGFIRIPPRK
ncbi:hypothetical protein U5N28_10780 [Lysinibacillus telephonicus]|nr:hypothetical protein [Lysinibacillus telephonicus]